MAKKKKKEKNQVKKPDIIYEKREETEAGAKKIVEKLLNSKTNNIAFLHVGVGGGKTFMTIRAIGAYKPNAHIFVLTTKKQVNAEEWERSIDGYNRAVKKANLTYTVVNYEKINHENGQKLITSELLKQQNKDLFIVVDEAQKIKNPSSNNFNFVQKLRNLPNVQGLIMLSGSPITEDLIDTQAYLILAGYYRNKTHFNKEHVTRYDPYFQPVTKDFKGVIHNEWLTNYELIIQRFKSIQVFIPTAHLLPPVIHKDIRFDYDKETKKDYNKIKKDYRDGIYESATQAIVAQRNFVGEHSEQFLEVLSSIIDNPKRKDAPILIFYKFNVDLAVLKTHLSKQHSEYDVFELNGRAKKQDEQFDTSKKPKKSKTIILCQYQAAAEAFNANWSYCTVFYGATYSANEYIQAKGRNVRNGQQGTVRHFRFILNKTINEHYWINLVDNKQKFTQQLMIDYLMKDDNE